MRGLLLLAALLLSACSTLPPPSQAPEGSLRGSLGDDWQFEGKAGIRQGEHANSANVDWEQQGDHFDIRLSGPLGQGGMQIVGDDTGVTMQVSGEPEPYQADTPEAVMQQALGWHLPVSQARYWVQGRPDPNIPYQLLSDTEGFEQSGWRIEIQRMTPINENLVLPGRLEFRYSDLSIRLVIRNWTPAD
ncbi:MAG: outer membrane lipoprotein LolB [Oceanospirillales bacterium]|nr:outer membrane lipoprotein LolB [Oceanospirillales bacterium]